MARLPWSRWWPPRSCPGLLSLRCGLGMCAQRHVPFSAERRSASGRSASTCCGSSPSRWQGSRRASHTDSSSTTRWTTTPQILVSAPSCCGGLEAVESRLTKKRPGDQPVAAYVGHLSAHKVDFALLLDVVRGMSDWKFVFAGPLADLGEAGRRVLKEPNVQYVGPLARADLPRVLGDADIALLPLPPSDLHESSFPMKVFDYLALGLPIVGRRTGALASCADLILDARHAGDYRRAMEEGRTLRGQQDFRHRAHEMARRNSWSRRIAELEAHLRRALGLVASSGHKDAERTKVSQGPPLREPATQRE